jgi:hypothetical protein
MRRITLAEMRRDAKECCTMSPGTVESTAFGMSCAFLRFLFGDEWMANNLEPSPAKIARDHREGRASFRSGETDEIQQRRLRIRIPFVAEILFNLQGVEGIDLIVDAIREGHVTSRYAELVCGTRLKKAGLSFRYLAPRDAKRGEPSPDIEITRGGRRVICEVKSKSDDTEPGVVTLKGTLKTARKQLPKGEQGIIFVMIPEQWIKEPAIERLVVGTTEEFFCSTTRVAGVVLQLENMLAADTQELWFSVVHRVYRNGKPGLLTPDMSRLLDEINSPQRVGPWWSFWDIATRACRRRGGSGP